MIEEESGFQTLTEIPSSPAEGISGYTLLTESASGSFRIFLARHFNRRVVLKAPGEGRTTDPLLIAQLKKEFSLAFPIDHPCVCRHLALVAMPDGTPALEMESCEGTDLRTYLDATAEGSVPSRRILHIVESLFDGLEAIHRAGIVHRDIKPSNIIYDPERGTVKIIDFGLADSPDHLQLKSPAGTPRYIPAEALVPGRQGLPADDLYALGMILAELSALAADPGLKNALTVFSRRLTNGEFSTVADARETFLSIRESGRNGSHRLLIFILAAAVAVAVIAAATFYLTQQPSGSHSIEVENYEESDRSDAAAQLPATQHEPHQTQPRPTDAPENTREAMPQVDPTSAAPVGSSPIEGAADRTSGNSAPASRHYTSEIEYTALTAGALLMRSESKETSPEEEADAIAIRLADAIYLNELQSKIRKKEMTKAAMDSLATTIATKNMARLRRQLQEEGLENADLERARELLRARLRLAMYTYAPNPQRKS